MFCGVTAAKLGQKLKNNTKERYAQAKTLFAMPKTPGIRHGPHTTFLLSKSVSLLTDTLLAATIPPVHLRYSNSPATNRYEEKRPAIETEMMPLNAVDEPMLTSASIDAMRAVATTEYTGMDVRSLTYLMGKQYSKFQYEQFADFTERSPSW